jgi:hypothetical protein
MDTHLGEDPRPPAAAGLLLGTPNARAVKPDKPDT